MRVMEGTVNRRRFEGFLKHQLVSPGAVITTHCLVFCLITNLLRPIKFPRMNAYPGPNSVLVLDNAAIHKGGKIARMARRRGKWGALDNNQGLTCEADCKVNWRLYRLTGIV